MKKFICGALSLVLAACCLTACSKPNETGQNNEGDSTSAVTDFVIGDVETHEPILPWQFEDGETAENPYYKRTVDENGNNVYAVLKANDQVAYLPMSNTVVYMGASEADCYFERTTNTYKLDGEDQTVIQFQLYVADTAQEMGPQVADSVNSGEIQEPVDGNGSQGLDSDSAVIIDDGAEPVEVSVSEGDSSES